MKMNIGSARLGYTVATLFTSPAQVLTKQCGKYAGHTARPTIAIIDTPL